MKTRILFLMAIAASVSAFGYSSDTTIDVPTGVTSNMDVYLNGNFTVTKTGGGSAIWGLKNYKDNKYFGGTIEVREGTLSATGNKSFGKPTTVTVSNGATLWLQGYEGGYFHEKGTKLYLVGTGTGSQGALRLSNTSPALMANLTLTGDATINTETAGSQATFNGVLSSSVRTFDLGSYTLTKKGLGTLLFDKGNFVDQSSGGINQTGGTTVFCNSTGTGRTFNGTVRVSGGTFILRDAGEVSIGSAYGFKVFGTTPDAASKLLLTGNTSLSQTDRSLGEESLSGNDYRYGIVELGAGTVVKSALSIGENGYEIGAVYQRGGEWTLPSGSGNLRGRAPIGNAAQGYYELSGGTFSTSDGTSSITIGSGATGQGLMAISGGTFKSGQISFASAAYGNWYQTGGTATVAGGESFGLRMAYGNGGCAEMTLSGAGTQLMLQGGTWGTDFVAGSATDGYVDTAILNVNDGATLAYKKLYKEANDAAKFYLNFNGGVLKPGNCWQAIGQDDADNGKRTAIKKPTAVMLYEKGLVVDITNAKNGSGNPDTTFIDCDLSAPTNGSIVSIAVPSGAKTMRYIHAPRVLITGDGQGASAVAVFDSTTERVTGIKVTSPGFGYTQATVMMERNAYVKTVSDRTASGNAWTCTATIGSVASGGLRVIGAGNKQRLNLLGRNTYAGVTVVENASVRFDGAATHPDKGGLDIGKGSEVRLTGPIVAGSLAGQGEIAGGPSVSGVTNLLVDATALFADGYTPLSSEGAVAFGENAKVTIAGLRELIDAAGDAETFAQALEKKTLLVAAKGVTGSSVSLELPGLTDDEAKLFKIRVSGTTVKFSPVTGSVIILR